MLAVVGGMLNQDAADSLRTGKDQEGNTYNTFDPKSLIDFQAENSPGITEGYYQQYNGDQLASALEGDGTRVSDTSVGHESENGDLVFDGTTGYRDDSFDQKYNDGNQPGKDFEVDETQNEDLNNAQKLGPTQPSYDPKDSTSAFIGNNATVTSAGDINITAWDNLTADMVTATISGSAYAGVGVGMVVAVLFSNVLAYVEDDAVLSAAGDITIYAGEDLPR